MIKVRASSLGELFDCPARWEAKHILGLRMPASGKAALGTAIHKGTAAYDSGVVVNSEISPDDAVSVSVDALLHPSEEVLWGEDETPQAAEKIAVSLTRKYCEQESKNHSYIAVEATCDELPLDIGIILTGSVDRIQSTPFGLGVVDIKTGATAVSASGEVSIKGHAFQMGVYELLAEQSLGQAITAPSEIVGLNTAKTEKSQRIGVGQVTGAKDLLLGDDESPGLLERAASLIKGGNFYGNPKSMMCGEKYCPVYKMCKFKL